ncbi:hypothetical protein KDA_42330 [Dictyobacter alpinus]|uniref:Uncharacterized protein n=1 Tax=Dictyobacter alpinus TaxID=2014873 RepID=A0A402BBN7_9CHLR|nr:hypothetical protein KDA_42330 [Dictyobacter alpinus]
MILDIGHNKTEVDHAYCTGSWYTAATRFTSCRVYVILCLRKIDRYNKRIFYAAVRLYPL